MKSFLFSLIAYTPRKRRTPWEDFFTEAFAGVLRLDPRLLPHILAVAAQMKRIPPSYRFNTETYYDVSTQFTLDSGRRPDMAVLVGGVPKLFVESKMGASFTGGNEEADGQDAEEQVPHYIEQAGKWPDCKVLLISLVPRKIASFDKEKYLGNLLWSDVYIALNRIEDSGNQHADVLRRELVLLMEDMDMAPPSPFRFGDSRKYWEYEHRMEQMRKLLDELLPRLEQAFSVETDGKRSSDGMYINQPMKCKSSSFSLGLRFSNEDEENAPIWPYLYFEDKEEIREAIQTLNVKITKMWNGKGVYPEKEQLIKFHSAWDWSQQIEIAYEIWSDWLRVLQDKSLI